MYQVYFIESITLDLCTYVSAVCFYFVSQSVSQSGGSVKLTCSANKTGGISCNTWHFKRIFDINVNVTKILRLGKHVENRARPLLVVVDDLSHKEFLVSHSYYLRRHSEYKDVYITTDMTKYQREKHRELVQELKQRRGKGEKGLMILNGEIVLRRYNSQGAASNAPSTEALQSS